MDSGDGGHYLPMPDIRTGPPAPVKSWPGAQHCSGCPNQGRCLPALLGQTDLSEFERIIKERHLARGSRLYRQSDPFRSIFAVRSGSLSLSVIYGSGTEDVQGFYFPGQLIGFQDIGGDKRSGEATAMESTTVCEIPYDALCRLARSQPQLQAGIFRMMSAKIIEDQKLVRLLGKGRAEQRIAAFLLAMALMYRQRGLLTSRFQLPMGRRDIANYLGLTMETVSRGLSEFARQDVIVVSRCEITLLDIDALRLAVDGMAFDE